MMDALNLLFRSAPWDALRLVLHLGLVLSLLLLLRQLAQTAAAAPLRHLARRRRWLLPAGGAVVLGLAAVLAYQASWQLGGTARPRFVAFMQSHDRRLFNPAHWIQRGRILDRGGTVLAESRERDGRVVRVYPEGALFAHSVGYADARYGLSGIEAMANATLNGSALQDLDDWGELGRRLLTQGKRPRGQDVVTTLDRGLQRLAVDLLRGEEGRRGAAVLLRPGDGAVLVLATTPAFDPNRLEARLFSGDDPRAPLLHRATQGLYPPGSAFKIVLAAQALATGFSGRIDCPAEGYTTSSRYRPIRDHEYYSARRAGRRWAGHGPLDLAQALARSSNVFFAKLGVHQGPDALARTGARMRFNQRIAFVGGASSTVHLQGGRLPRIAEQDRYGLAQASIGQGRVLATPAHLALIAAAVANDGVAMRPRLLRDSPPQALGRFLSAPAAAELVVMLRRAVRAGTGRGIETPGLQIAGKTGTAETRAGEPHSWFVGLAPAGRPRLAFAVLVEHGGYGAAAAAPIARTLLLRAAERGLL